MKSMIGVIAGTNRAGSNTRRIAVQVAEEHRALGEEVTMLDLAEMPQDCFSPGAYGEKPPSFTAGFVEPVLASDGLVVITPEYNGGFPGALKLFIDLLPFPEAFESRPVSFIGLSAGASGAVRPVEQLQMVFAYRNAVLFNRRVFLPRISAVLGEEGGLIDEELVGRLRHQAEGFQTFVEAQRSAGLLPGNKSTAAATKGG